MRASAIVQRSLLPVLAALAVPGAAAARGDLGKVNHVVVVMQENHSFDNDLGALPYVPGGPYHPGPCAPDDHACVDGLSCTREDGALRCRDANRDDDRRPVRAFHLDTYCPGPDLAHDWPGSHQEVNDANPMLTWLASPMNGFVLVNDGVTPLVPPLVPDGGGQHGPDASAETRTDDATMGYYDQGDLPFYYALAQTFAIDDRYFSSVIGPTFPNRSYALAATSFGHLSTWEILPPLPPAVPPPGGYRPATGTIMDLLDRAGVSWTNYFVDVPTTAMFRGYDLSHAAPVTSLLAIAAPGQTSCALPAVSFVDPAFGNDAFGTNPTLFENDEHPPSDVRSGEWYVAQVLGAIRASPCWKDTVVFVTYDEHGGFHDHVPPPRAPQGGARTPDGVAPGQCADLSAPPASEQPGGGVECAVSRADAASICPGFTATGAYPWWCASFDQLGVRVPFIAVSPFARPHHVSHAVADHASILAFVEKRFLSSGGVAQHLTARDAHASTLEDLFDFDAAPSLAATIPDAPPPAATDPGCPFTP